jgi:rubrerythrin
VRNHWTLDTIAWDKFDRSKIDPALMRAVKAASLVEKNAADYVAYLRKVFDGDAETIAAIEQWGAEEVQHGDALGRWAEMADPTFKFEREFARFREGYTPPHFLNADGSVRGSRIGELIARCVVECGTSSGYTALRDATDEPVLKQIAGMIAADEFRHYRLFYDLMHKQNEQLPAFWARLKIAATRVSEAEDDELSYAFYAANVPPELTHEVKYDRKACFNAYQACAMRMYRRPHIERATAMIGRAIGLHPESTIVKLSGRAFWEVIRWRAWAAGDTGSDQKRAA